MTSRLLVSLAFALLVGGSIAGGQAPASAPPAQKPPAPAPTFRSTVQVIEVDARVFDKDGRFVTGLTRDDFEVLEGGASQQIDAIYLVGDLQTQTGGGAGASPTSGAPSVGPTFRSGGPPSPPVAPQTWIFFFDLNHLTPGGGFDRARKAVEEFIAGRFKDGDLAGVLAGDRMVNNRLTSVRTELLDAIKQVKPRADSRTRNLELTRDWPRLLNEDEALRIARHERDIIQRAVTRACSDDPDQCQMAEGAVMLKGRRFATDIQRASQLTMSSLNGLASGLARIPGPKTVVLLSDGFAVQDIETTLRSVVGQTARAGARVYAIDVRGLNRGGLGGAIEQLQAEDSAGAVTKFDAVADGPNSLAIDTGGMMIRNENNIGRALTRIADDAGRYYVLAYRPANTTFDGKFRAIQVRVKRDGLRVRARRGYLALDPARMTVPQPVKPGHGSTLPNTESGHGATPLNTGNSHGSTPPSTAGGHGSTPLNTANSHGSTPPNTAGGHGSTPLNTGSGDGSTPLNTANSHGATPFNTENGPGSTPLNAAGKVPPPATAVRLRPDSEGRVNALSALDTMVTSDLAKIGWEAYQRGDVETAMSSLSKAALKPDVRPWVLYALGMSQAALGRQAEALASWERVRQAAPDFEP
ncbi:MAG TPA: VWA domain-containing protein, partial [Gemmatimonadaceae bacterium]|nr:VWA domain-containing protein [Gemmatimonadaceae bacterium]